MNEREIFTAALSQGNPQDRAAYLAEACASDAALRERVELLLAEHAQLGSFLDCPTSVVALDRPASEHPGMTIGPYKLLQQIGEGGMGTVFMAEQTEPVQRKVALKVIKPGMDTRQVIARFEAERQALSLMDHPNIAKVLDAGTTGSGRPYFVMELVKGQPITQYCDEHHLTPRQRLELLLPVCQAIQHAHQKGIIHRDIKPSNILVAEYDHLPVPKVIDFGVAKATSQALTEKTMFTGLGQIIGTLEYMSPEQAKVNQLDIDTRSDIYSLGVLLYELLTGSTPLDRKRLQSAAWDEMLRIIREEDPEKPSTRLSRVGSAHHPAANISTGSGGDKGRHSPPSGSLASIAALRHTEPAKLTKLIRGELDWIVMKCLDKDRNRRYETANDFAQDVQRYLADEPVQACPPSAAYRFHKFARRNKSAVAVATVILFFVTLLGSGAGWAVRDRAAREAAVGQQRQAREVEVAREKATRQTLTKERVTLALEEARKRHQEGRRREALHAAKRAEALAAAGQSDQETQQRVGEVLDDMEMLADLENVRVKSTKNETGYDLKEQDSGNTRIFREYGIDIDTLDRDAAGLRIRSRSIRCELAVFLDSWSHVRRRLAQRGSKQIGKDWKELLEVARAADPDPWRDQFRKAVLQNDAKALIQLAESAPISALPAETVDRLGDALIVIGANQEAVDFLKRGQRLHPQDYWINNNLGLCLVRLGQQEEAIRYFTVSVALSPEAAVSLNNLAWALATHTEPARRDPGGAVSLAMQAVELKPRVATFRNTLGVALYRAGRWKDAIVALEKSVELRKGGDSFDWYFLAMAHWQLVEKDKSREWYDRAMQSMDENQLTDGELRRIREEAAELLDLKEKKDG